MDNPCRAVIRWRPRYRAARACLRQVPAMGLAALLLGPTLATAQRPELGADITSGISGSNNTRVEGTVYDSDGNLLTDVQIWVTNVDAPANRVRVRTRKTGTYLARGLDRLFGRDDIYGINLRLRFEKAGYQVVESTIVVQKDGLGEIHPILHREGEASSMSGICGLLRGTITREGQPMKGARVTIRGLDGDFTAEAAADKKGVFEAVLWNAPKSLELQAEGATMQVNLLEPTDSNVLSVQLVDIALDP